MYGLILYRDTFPGGPVAYFADVSQWTFYAKNQVYIAQTVVGDGVIVRFFRRSSLSSTKCVAALPLLCGMAIQTNHDLPFAALVCRCWYAQHVSG